MAVREETITGSCTIGGKTYGVNSIMANIAVNTWPTYRVSVLLDAKGKNSAVLIDDKVFNLIGKWLGQIIGSGLKASLKWKSSGGVGENVSGFVLSAEQIVGYGNLSTDVVMAPDYVKVDAMSFGVYQLASHFNGDAKDKTDKPKLEGKSLMQYIEAVVKSLFTMWERYGEEGMKDMSKEEQDMYNHQHQINKMYADIFYELLHNSEKYVGKLYSIDKMKMLGLPQQEPLFDAIYNCLVQSLGTFLSTICALANMFRLVYVPLPNKVGSYVPKTYMLTSTAGGGRNAVVASLSQVFRTGVLPVGRVFTICDHDIPNCDEAFVKKIFNGSTAKIDIKGPYRTIGIAPPPWIPVTAKVIEVENDGTAKKTVGITPDRAAELQEEIAKQEDSDKYYREALHEWCRLELADLLVGGSTNYLSTFLDDFECGRRRKEAFGTGFVNGCSIGIELQPGGKGRATTIYNYTHVFYKGAKIPSID